MVVFRGSAVVGVGGELFLQRGITTIADFLKRDKK